ncbi:MAG: peptide chain release factor 1 [Candidatus Omnitrophica bacterium]|nr:peptide chain release factor 1 [Candidatus Omnitrophota bacterium]
MPNFNELQEKENRYEELERLLAQPEILSDLSRYNQLAKEMSSLKVIVTLFRDYKSTEKEISELELMLKEKHEAQFLDLIKKEIQSLREKLKEIEVRLEDLLSQSDPDLNKDVIIEIRQGTGGTEAGLFASDLYRMYTKYASKKNWKIEVLSSHPNELGGFKEIIFSIRGKDAYKRLKFESGVHRVQRVPITEAGGRIHTSTATVAVLVEPEEIELQIDPKDLKIETFRSSGPGGQHMQKTESAVRITHLPTGMVVACQDERSQIKNKHKAMRILRARLLEMRREEEQKKISQLRRSQIGSGERSEKIRTYNFPERRITDHRIGLTVYRLEEVLEGDLDIIVEAFIKNPIKEK